MKMPKSPTVKITRLLRGGIFEGGKEKSVDVFVKTM